MIREENPSSCTPEQFGDWVARREGFIDIYEDLHLGGRFQKLTSEERSPARYLILRAIREFKEVPLEFRRQIRKSWGDTGSFTDKRLNFLYSLYKSADESK